MLYLFSALYCEVQPLLKPLRLKSCAASPFQQFSNEDKSILLTLTNPGPISAAAAVSAVLSKFPPKDSDFLLSLGTCARPLSHTAASFITASPDEYADIYKTTVSCGQTHTKPDSATSASDMPVAPVFRLTKLIDFSGLRSFYPDLIYPSHFPEAGCVTGARVLDTNARVAVTNAQVLNTGARAADTSTQMLNTSLRVPSTSSQASDNEFSAASTISDSSDPSRTKTTEAPSEIPAWQADLLTVMHQLHCPLYDMEAAAVYQAGSLFLGPQQLHFLRLVTDAGEGRSVKAEDITRAMQSRLPELLSEIQDFLERSHRLSEKPPVLKPEDEALLDRLCTDLRCSAVMTAQLRQLVKYLSLAELPWHTHVEALYENGTLPCRDKRSGKKVLDAFRAEFL